MKQTKRTIETTGMIDRSHRLVLDEPLQIEGPAQVRVIILLPEEDFEEQEWGKVAAENKSFEFLKDKSENIYNLSDGNPFVDKG